MKDKILIIDVGSTTTKALLLQKKEGNYHNLALVHTATTVEKPQENVMLGIRQAIDILSQNTGIDFWQEKQESILSPEITFLCTSSAGGGLQILVIGLTTFDSAASGKRCAYGAGAVILDTFAINDKRSAVQQMKAMAKLHPDLILMTGGTDGGAIAPVVRLAELLQFANPRAKFSQDPIPLVYAGNIQARDLIQGVLHKRFQLHMVENVRPAMDSENHTPARNLIHDIFMNCVMEQAPGYKEVLRKVDHDIIPTPLGVLEAIELLHQQKDKEIMMVDIGGATTDVFSNMQGEFYRTVSANYGMSYSISNVFKDTGWETICRDLPEKIDPDYVHDYIADKMLFPTTNPSSSLHFLIEHLLARAALFLAREQHLEMNFNTDHLGFLDKLVNHKNIESIVSKFYFKDEQKKEKFFFHDYEYAIGAGGVISHTQNPEQALMLIADGLKMQGLTKILRDRDFTSPHLGKLSQIDKQTASSLLFNECLEELGWHLRPQTRKWKPKVMRINYDDKDQLIMSGKKYLIQPDSDREIEYKISLLNGYLLNNNDEEITLKTKLPLYIDTTSPETGNDVTAFHQLYDQNDNLQPLTEVFPLSQMRFAPKQGTFIRKITLPYLGEIFVKAGDRVNPEMIVAENRSDPPKLYIVTLFNRHNLGLTADNLRENLLIKAGDRIKMGQKIVNRRKLSLKEQMMGTATSFESPLRGIVENINYESGTIILREIQDYSNKPVPVKISSKLGIKPDKMKGYLKVRKGDFVYSGDLLAAVRLDRANMLKSSILDKMNQENSFAPQNDQVNTSTHNSVISPATGTVVDINLKDGSLTIKYDRNPLQHLAGVEGMVRSVEKNITIDIEYQGWKLQGNIGFGTYTSGTLVICKNNIIPGSLPPHPVILCTAPTDNRFLKKAEELNVAGVIAPSIHYRELKKFIGTDIGVALTGNEEIPFPFIIMQGFGNVEMPSDMEEFFRHFEGDSIFIDGHTQIRAGVIRPLIIIQKKV